MEELERTIEEAWERRNDPEGVAGRFLDAVREAVARLDAGKLRVAEPVDGAWRVCEWAKKAVLLWFRLHESRLVRGAHTNFYDKVPLKYAGYDAEAFARDGVRVVPDAVVRYGAHVAPDAVLMPCYVNIGARIGRGTM